ncbi:OmpA family protein [Massilia sp. CCM 8733]|uniref:OmpA family protein n=1 Tax=Massilia mucilaginosa TaxID=2609282 RepID=A0ABX0NWM0_9BURK|nr:OmpA family protein [Massilia mucilaginosa]NHZ91262.1 OmpA family protein [Massilia mucilaginosa]
MTKQLNAALCLSMSLAFAIAGCKPKAPVAPAEAPVASAPAAEAPVAPAEPAATPAPAAAANAADVDLDKIAVVTKPLPPFPFVDYPEKVIKEKQSTEQSDFDQVYLVVGNKARPVEGRVRTIEFYLSDAGISQFQAQRDYAKAFMDMGGVKVNTIEPNDNAFDEANAGKGYELRGKMGYWHESFNHETYFLPTPTGRRWMVLMGNESAMRVLVVEEKQAASSLKAVSAAVMKSELDTKGRVALYINFDTDKAAIRADGKPAVDEIAALMKKETALRLSIEGHTDNLGDKARNATLSRERAQAVVQSLLGDGIDGARLVAAGHGADKPLTDNGSEEGRAKNRRVELVKVVKG